MLQIVMAIFQLAFRCGDPTPNANINIDYIRLCDKLKQVENAKLVTVEMRHIDSLHHSKLFVYEKNNYSITLISADLDSTLNQQTHCAENDSAVVSQFAHTISLINSNCKIDKFTKNDSVIIEKAIISLAKQKRINLQVIGDKKNRLYDVSILPYGISMCGGSSPTYEGLSDLTPYAPPKGTKRKYNNTAISFPFTSLGIVVSFHEWINGGESYSDYPKPQDFRIDRSFYYPIKDEEIYPEINPFERESEERFPYKNDSISQYKLDY